MALFKLRSPAGKGEHPGESAGARSAVDSVEVMRRRARHRLIGATVLVVLGVVGFPLLFDTQPRPIPVDIPIEIPDRNKARPLAMPADTVTMRRSEPASAATPAASAARPAVGSAATAAAPASSPAVAASSALDAREQIVPPAADLKAERGLAGGKPPETRPAAARPADDGAKAQALLEGRPAAMAAAAPAAGDDGRFIVQIGAFSDPARAREARMKVERAGIKTYTQEVDTADGKRIRVRVGPFGSRAGADKAASRIKGLDLPASILTL